MKYIGIIKLLVSSVLHRELLSQKIEKKIIMISPKKRKSFSGSTGKNTLEKNIKLIKIDRRSNRQDPNYFSVFSFHNNFIHLNYEIYHVLKIR